MKKCKILIVDDEKEIRDVSQSLLERAGYQVDVCQNGEEALQLLDKGADYQLVLTDFDMPGINGLELIREIEKKYPRCKTLLMSGTPPGNNIDPIHYLLKPFNFVELVSMIEERISLP